jgi:hypothetical protein
MGLHLDDELWATVRLKLKPTTLAWLVEIADLHHDAPENIMASILNDVADDDMNAHSGVGIELPEPIEVH